ncbi:MAG: translation initiation factor IF-3 [Alphaproteobacteria bacterium RIFCSPHIGHO2_01_FULL_41_14]|nr:MAG: translation initiation factor IF-3 [Alphaproteobacteria bacterium GWB1_45_5]OFW75999.1 MAG: translation initiation factor IF-3 [Alphaproteobacteria bacterium GWA1_45_9]OFW89313.1 MAG: translation initiation factor IF-3 [Alphaproteobacteria bacterium RIFCSPHIGHO2_01_FULL_41_14]HCI48237.1 translation initiation factor IF-3 [Holosporales bacterium]
MTTPRPSDGPRINEEIRVESIRLIDEEGNMVGVVSVREGIERAQEAGLDLIEVSPNAEPPVCKILDYGKYKYELQKKKNEAKKNQKIVEIKEIKLRPVIGEHDYLIKMKQVRRFLEEENKVKITMRFRGREMAHKEVGIRLLDRLKNEVEDIGMAETEPKSERNLMIMILAPRKA